MLNPNLVAPQLEAIVSLNCLWFLPLTLCHCVYKFHKPPLKYQKSDIILLICIYGVRHIIREQNVL